MKVRRRKRTSQGYGLLQVTAKGQAGKVKVTF